MRREPQPQICKPLVGCDTNEQMTWHCTSYSWYHIYYIDYMLWMWNEGRYIFYCVWFRLSANCPWLLPSLKYKFTCSHGNLKLKFHFQTLPSVSIATYLVKHANKGQKSFPPFFDFFFVVCIVLLKRIFERSNSLCLDHTKSI